MINIGAIKLGGVDLNNSLQWVNRFQQSTVDQSTRRTLGGSMVIYQQALSEGIPITLTASVDTGWLTKAMYDAIVTLSKDPSVTRVLEFHGEFYNVKFLFEGGVPISFAPLQAKQAVLSTDWMIGSIKLFTV